MIITIIVLAVVSVFIAVILISELWYIKEKKDSDKAYLEDLRIQSIKEDMLKATDFTGDINAWNPKHK